MYTIKVIKMIRVYFKTYIYIYNVICIFQRLNIDDEERSIVIDLRPYMDSAPYIIRLVSTRLLIYCLPPTK